MNESVRIVAFGDSITNGVGLAGVTEADTFRDNPSALNYFPGGLRPDTRGHRVIGDLLIGRLVPVIGRPPVGF